MAAPSRCDVAIVGGGLLGLAVARELLTRRTHLNVCVLEKEPEFATHQSGHSSGVIHAGIYYAPGSLKAHLCVEGARELYDYCERREVPHERCGKVILATRPDQIPRLQELRRRGLANGVGGLRELDRDGLEALEPHARALAGLHSPDTGIVDFPAVARALAADVREKGGTVACDCEVKHVRERERALQLVHARGTLQARHAIFCAGAWSDRLAGRAGAAADPRIVPFRGAYIRLRPERRTLVRALIYPVPDPSLPFLGVHFTRHVDGEVTIGPTALLALARDAYALRTAHIADVRDTLAWPGTWRLFARFWRSGAQELRRSLSRAALVAAAARLVPELRPADVEPGFAGVRAQALARDGQLVEDFVFSATPRALHVRNAPSPAATASLAIARHICEAAERSFSLAP